VQDNWLNLSVLKEKLHRIINDDINLYAYRITTQPRLNDHNKKRRISFAY
jgi:hypothetical protein